MVEKLHLVLELIVGIVATIIGTYVYFHAGAIAGIFAKIPLTETWLLAIAFGILMVIEFYAIIKYVFRKHILQEHFLFRSAIGIILIAIVGIVILYGVQVWQAGFQLSNATNPNFLETSVAAIIEAFAFYIEGILLIVGGFGIISPELTLIVAQYIAENIIRNSD